MKLNQIDILLIAEVHKNTNSTELHDEYTYVFSSNVTEKQIADAQYKRQQVGTERAKVIREDRRLAKAKAAPKPNRIFWSKDTKDLERLPKINTVSE